MTYFNPEVYDPEKLVGEEKAFMAGYVEAMDQVESYFANYIDIDCSAPTISKIFSEQRDEIKNQLLTWLSSSQLEITCSLMENNPEVYCDDWN